MAAGARSLLAFWIGGAGSAAPATSAGVRGLLAPWIGGAGSAAPATSAGVHSLLAPWIGGAGAAPSADSAGLSSLLAFWMGGAAADASAPPVVDHGGGGGRIQLPRELIDMQRQRRIDRDDLLLLIAGSVAAYRLH